MSDGPAFYARSGSTIGDLVTLLHPPYTLWHLSYVVIGASLAPVLSFPLLGWTLLVFFLALGIAAHALDEVNGRPLRTGFSDGELWTMAVAALGAGAVIVAVAAVYLTPWVLAWATAGLLFAVGYPLERPTVLHTDLGFAVAWGGYPVLVGFWVQAQEVTLTAIAAAVFAVLLSLAQRSLSTPARFVRRHAGTAVASFDESTWDRTQLLATWELPLRWLTLAAAALALALLASHI